MLYNDMHGCVCADMNGYVYVCVCACAFVLLCAQPPGSTGVADLSALLKFSRSVNIVLCRVCHPKLDGSGGEGSGGVGAGGSVRVDLLSTVELEWRVALLRGEASLALELTGVGDEAKMGVPVGVLHVELAITPSHGGVVPFAQVGVWGDCWVAGRRCVCGWWGCGAI